MKYLILIILLISCSFSRDQENFHNKMMNNQITKTYPIIRWEQVASQRIGGYRNPKVIVNCKSGFTFDSEHIFNTNDSIKVNVGLRKIDGTMTIQYDEYLIQLLEIKKIN